MKLIFILLIIVGFVVIKYFITRIYYLYRFYRSYEQLDEIGLINTVSGKIGAGKSILCSCFTQLLTFKIINKLQANMEEIERILIEVDFVKVENLISKHQLTIDNFNDKFIYLLNEYRIFDNRFKDKLVNRLSDVYFDYINYKDRTKLLKRWVECYLHLNRSSYVFANVRVFNHVTSSYSYPFKNEWTHLKITDEFPLVKNSIFFEDDKSLYSNNLQFMKKLHEDTGSDTFMRLFRHLFEEKSYYIVSLQDVDRWIKHEREISTNHIYVNSSYVVAGYSIFNFLLDVIEKFFNIILWFLKKVYKNDRYYNNLNFFKKLNFKLDLFRKKLFSKTYVKSECYIYDDIDKVGKEIKEDDTTSYKFSFVAPVYYFFGNLNTHEFHEVYQYVYGNSKNKYCDLTEFLFDKERVLEVLGVASDNVKVESNVKNIF